MQICHKFKNSQILPFFLIQNQFSKVFKYPKVFPRDFKEEQAPSHQKSHQNPLNFLKVHEFGFGIFAYLVVVMLVVFKILWTSFKTKMGPCVIESIRIKITKL
ncbi:hypothetical protein HanXRQr2_Chr03g0111151 [Helianthus annuus]|uniref:Uncharacterized protein n=1 Tax=Helianthus annuus TaxID=4232 RepID=A0A251SHU1_HELAN|nr:hypothetical protein HanXRQr2_Chr03g0111151 [Helianthus annuus]